MASIINALSSGTGGIVTAGDASGILQLQTANTAAVTIDGSQNVGIGTASPDLKLSVAGGMNLRNSSRAGAFEIDSSGNLWAGTATTAGNIYLETGHTTSGLPSTGTARVTVNQYGLGLGATPSSGTGITFPASQSASSDANTLDDYEEGTWTPTLTASSSNPTVSYQTQTGVYTKIGRTVTISGRLQITSRSGGSGDLRISGLPFANAVAINGAHFSWVSGLTLTAGFTWADLYMSTNDTNLNIAQSGSGQGASQMLIGAAANNFDMAIQFTYTT